MHMCDVMQNITRIDPFAEFAVDLLQILLKVTEDAADKTRFAAMAKLKATDAGFKVANDALQLHGGYGYLMDYPIERFVRDLRVHQILEGTNQVMRIIIGRDVLKD